MKTTTYPKQHITEVGDMLYNAPKPERVLIDEVYLAKEIGERLDDQDRIDLELGDSELTLFVGADVHWHTTEQPDEAVGFRGGSAPCLWNIDIKAYSDEGGTELEPVFDEQKLINEIYGNNY